MAASRMSPGSRRVLQVVGVLLLVLGACSFVYAIVLMTTAGPQVGSESFAQDVQEHMGRTALFGFGGVFLVGIGSMLAHLGFRKVMVELAATDAEVAIEHVAHAARRGWGGPGGAGKPDIRLRCRSCGHLETDDARFCSSCAKPI